MVDEKTSVALHPRSNRYKGVGRPRTSDFNSQLFMLKPDGVWSVDFDTPSMTKGEMILELNRGA